MRFNLLLRIAGCRSQSLFNGFKSIDTESVGIPNLFCSSIDNLITGEFVGGVSPDKIFRIFSECSCNLLDFSCCISGEVLFGMSTMFTSRPVPVKV